jgi:O-antigen/teichoic acid export membrane protein
MAGSPGLRRIFSNTGTLTAGRLLLALLRFVITLAILRRAGLDRFGEFALFLSVVAVAEWLSDFGLTDVAVRQIAADAQRQGVALGAFAVAKAGQAALAAALLPIGLALAGYAEQVVRSAALGGGAVLIYAGVQVYRVEFRVRLHMGREMAAELVAAVVFLLAIWIVTSADASLEMMALCYLLSRAVNLLAAALLAGSWPNLGFEDGWRSELTVLLRASVPLGLTGLMVSSYDAMEQIALSQWSTSAEVGTFSFAMRVMMLAMIVEQALATAAFPLLATLWAQNRDQFARTLQVVLDWGLLIGGALFCALHTSASGLVALVKPDHPGMAEVLQCLSWAIPARAAVALVGPVLVISGTLSRAVWIPVVVVAAKWLALMALASHGAIGAAFAFLIAEIGVGLLPNLLFSQYASGVWLGWSVPLKITVAAAAVAGTTSVLNLSGTLLQGVLAAAAFLALAASLGAIEMHALKQLIGNLVARRNGRS